MSIYISTALDQSVRKEAGQRCGYCLSPQSLVMARLEIEHIIPLSLGGKTEEGNLWLACPLCNRYKGNKTTAIDPVTGQEVPLFNPRHQRWQQHFQWSDDGLRIVGISDVGRATVVALHLDDDPDALLVRSYWVLAGWHPPNS